MEREQRAARHAEILAAGFAAPARSAVRAPGHVDGRLSTAVENQAIWRRDSGPVQRSFSVIEPLLCSARTDRFFVPACGLEPARAAAVKEARRAPRSGA